MARDMTRKQFLEALDRNGIGRPELMGYCSITHRDGGFMLVSYLNAETNRWRDRLAYLLAQQAKERIARRCKEASNALSPQPATPLKGV